LHLRWYSYGPSEYGNIAVRELFSDLDETFTVLGRLTDRAESEKSNLQSIALPANEKSLAYVQAVLKHSFSPSKVSDLVNNLKGMQSEVRTCLEKLEGAFGHVNALYGIIDNHLARVATSTSTVSTSTMLTARIKLAGWLKRREGTWGLSTRGRSTTVRVVTLREIPYSYLILIFSSMISLRLIL